jgi:hypothetical protein
MTKRGSKQANASRPRTAEKPRPFDRLRGTRERILDQRVVERTENEWPR